MLPSMALSSMSRMLLSCLMLLCQVQGSEDSQDKMHASPCISCPKGSKAYGSYCYALFRTQKSWTDTDLSASIHLVSVLSEAVASFASSLVKSSGSSYPYSWIRLHDPTLMQISLVSVIYQVSLIKIPMLVYFNWSRNPSTASDCGPCGSVSQNSGNSLWRDYNCNAQLPYVCKFED
ncbi:Regenerating islet-derived protein 3 gamma [Heterocephalus glaber]|uniref:Regenerating islet-derived protein 3 gamma n=1 Tax=Heterocephalus glaber TaxID=10181 RepID=G5BWU2_HETGA|nr:Regenerating islet-derived protein 3 gamma [Heterocephalus glaber]